ncbi:SURF1 family protein [Sulfitobacter sp. KE29]|uniref:SURF1 family protein n=1 Tax=Sulfitobacter TaxID=60136 RepID=UPI0007C2E184|nr:MULTISPECIES: SURF1 family protein [Sulfitobacter]KZY49525.1 cytochrome oxidase biogenesis protein Surf1, facilitates heme A insertion [Sulfitobacter sp. HI0054]MBO9439882.1 SURF1 family protein [Sulfitobacter sp. R18_2]MDF3418249.1 SURF1 family protein [Sulfitobacter sp. Ks38]MDF3425732.1 SURF1 family protein [Sulfitobacter sp. KE29]MDF3429312.1 SURF1 family protein [Sulfitobacter sp. S46]
MRRSLFFIIVGLGGAAILVALGVWQVQRLAWKEAIIADINNRIAAAPVALPADPDPEADAYLPVTVSGEIGAQALHVLVSQKQKGAGYRVIAPMALESGRRVLIDLGFTATSNKDAIAPAGTATLTGNLQWPQEVDSFTPEADMDRNIWFARDVELMAETLDTEPLLIVMREGTGPDPKITPLPVDTARIPNDHLQYAITWFSLAAIWLAMTVLFLRRRRAPATPKVD